MAACYIVPRPMCMNPHPSTDDVIRAPTPIFEIASDELLRHPNKRNREDLGI